MSYFFLRAQVEVGICQGRARVGRLEVCGSGPGVPLSRQGLGYDHDRMAAALRFYSAGQQQQPRRLDYGAFPAFLSAHTEGKKALAHLTRKLR